jgi:hypothetical protein
MGHVLAHVMATLAFAGWAAVTMTAGTCVLAGRARLLARRVAVWLVPVPARRLAPRRHRRTGAQLLPAPSPPWPAFMADPAPDHDVSELPPAWRDPAYVSPATVTRFDIQVPRSWREGP